MLGAFLAYLPLNAIPKELSVDVQTSLQWKDNKVARYNAINISDHDIWIDPPASTYFWSDTNTELSYDDDSNVSPPITYSWEYPFNIALGSSSNSFSYNCPTQHVPKDFALEVSVKYFYTRKLDTNPQGFVGVLPSSNTDAVKQYVDWEGPYMYKLRHVHVEIDHGYIPLAYQWRFLPPE